MKLTTDNFGKEIIHSEKLAVIVFLATWCGVCERMKPIFDEFTKDFEGKIITGEICIDDEEFLAAKYEIEVLPTFVFFEKGKVVKRISGKVEKVVLAEKVEFFLHK